MRRLIVIASILGSLASASLAMAMDCEEFRAFGVEQLTAIIAEQLAIGNRYHISALIAQNAGEIEVATDLASKGFRMWELADCVDELQDRMLAEGELK